jgi:hypothetical protein
MWGSPFSTRPVWLDVLLGAAFGVAGQLLVAGGLIAGAGWSGPVVTLLAPAAVAVVAALVIRPAGVRPATPSASSSRRSSARSCCPRSRSLKRSTWC